jgi:hypothetical protein
MSAACSVVHASSASTTTRLFLVGVRRSSFLATTAHARNRQPSSTNTIFLCRVTARNHARHGATRSPVKNSNHARRRWLSSPSASPEKASSSSSATSSTPSSPSSSTSSLKKKLLGDEPIIPCRSILPLSLVNHPNVRMAVPVIGNFAYLGIASGFLMTDMLQLRILLSFGYMGLVTFHILRPVPLRIPLRWSAVFVLVNAGAAGLLIADQYMAPLTEEQLLLHQNHFSVLTKGQFYQLMSLSTREELEDQTVLTVEGVPCSKLYFIERGGAQVYHHKDHASNIEAGGFVNDVAFQREGDNVGAYGTVVASGKCSALVWDQAKLREHLSTRPAMDRNLKYILSSHLVKSLLRQREAAHARQRRLLNRRRQREEEKEKSSSSAAAASASESSSSSRPLPYAAPQSHATISRSPSQHHVSW